MSIVNKKRIILNIAATYGRNLFNIVCSFITSGWVFAALGEVNFGLYGVVGGLTAFVTFFNGILSVAISRFYAFSVGEAHDKSEAGLENCRRWFNTAVTIHSVIPVILLLIGYPVGVHAVSHWLTIPADRIQDCIWIWRFSCLSCFIGMISVPFNAMYAAKQYIAELTIYSFFTTISNLLFVIYMHYHPREWLVSYAAWVCFWGLIPQIIIPIRAYIIFPECKFIRSYLFSRIHIRQIFSFSLFNGLGCFCGLLRTQGITILTNVYLGPAVNAAMSIASSVVVQISSLSGSINGAFSPVITNACGAGNFKLMKDLVFKVNKIGTAIIMFFALPIMLELPKILEIWLKNPPQYTVVLSILSLLICLVDASTTGNMLAINATGKIKRYHVFLCFIAIFTLPIAWVVVALGGNVYVMNVFPGVIRVISFL